MHFKLRIPLTGNIKLARLRLTHIEEFKFDLDLAYGQDREQHVAAIFDTDKFKVEVKTERDWWYHRNIAIS